MTRMRHSKQREGIAHRFHSMSNAELLMETLQAVQSDNFDGCWTRYGWDVRTVAIATLEARLQLSGFIGKKESIEQP